MKGTLTILLILQLALSSNSALFPVGDRAVVIRIDDIQDYSGPSPYAQPEKMVLQYHIDHHIPALVSIIPTRFGTDPQLIDQVKEGLALGIFTVAIHGWHHSPITNLSRSVQVTEMQYGRNKLEKILDSPVLAFVPPYNEFNQDTVYAVKTNGLTLMSSSIYLGDVPRREDVVDFLPQTVTTAVVAENDTWTELPLESVTNEIKNSWDSYGVAVVVVHPRQFVGIDNNSRWSTYTSMLEWITSNQGRIVRFEPRNPETMKGAETKNRIDPFLISVGIFAGLTSTLLIAFNTSARKNNRKSPGAAAGGLKATFATYRTYLSSAFHGVKAFTKIAVLSHEDAKTQAPSPEPKAEPAIMASALALEDEKTAGSTKHQMLRTDSILCQSCRKRNPSSATHCGSCGASLLPAVSCRRCGRRIARDDVYCDGCGFRAR